MRGLQAAWVVQIAQVGLIGMIESVTRNNKCVEGEGDAEGAPPKGNKPVPTHTTAPVVVSSLSLEASPFTFISVGHKLNYHFRKIK